MAFAVPAKRERHTLMLADGSKVEATWMGDETLHFYQTDDGSCLQCDSNGIAHFVEPEALYNRWKTKVEKRQTIRAKRALSRKKTGKILTGNKRGLVILVQFPKTPFYYTPDAFQSYFNEEGYSDGTNIGSVHDYFHDASYGQLDFSFDIAGPVTMSQPLSYYGTNNSNGDDMYPATMVTEAIQMIDNDIDFSQYDWGDDGKVEQIFVIHSGFDEAQSARRTDIWSHAWTLTEAKEEGDGNGPIMVDGVLIDSYATCSELQNKSGTKIAGIGTACHEFSHCLGLPDFYDTKGRNFCMDTWDIMDNGCYNGNGGIPAGFTSYERAFCGWLEPIELMEPVAIQEMSALTSEPVAYILRNSGKRDEYYLLENRQKEGWDSGLGGHGLLILHVDYDKQAWDANTVNTVRSHLRMTIIPADNLPYSGTLAGDPWPGSSRKTELSNTSTPAATLYNVNADGDKLMNHSITEIYESINGGISFIFDEEALDINGIHSSKFIDYSDVYDLSGRKCTTPMRGIYIRRTPDGCTKFFMNHEFRTEK